MEINRKAMLRMAATLCAAAASVNGATAQTNPASSQIIVKWQQTVSSPSSNPAVAQLMSDMRARAGVSMTMMRTLATGGQVIRVDRQLMGTELQALLAGFANSSLVAYAHEDHVLKPAVGFIVPGFGMIPGAAPDDTEYAKQWYFFEQAGVDMQLTWDYASGTGVNIALVDTGIRRHADLAANLLGGYDFISDPFAANDGNGRDPDPQDTGNFVPPGLCAPGDPGSNSTWHGTSLAGNMVALTNNAAGVAGVAFSAKVVPVRAIGRCGGRLSDVVEAAIWAAGGPIAGVPANPNRARVVNLSLSAPAPCDATAQQAVNIIKGLGAVIVVAAGNDNADARTSLPANCPGVITVAAVARDGSKAFYSNFGSVVDVAAPGGDMRNGLANGIVSISNSGTTTPGTDTFAYWQGTSISAALVSGLAALLLSRAPDFSADEVEASLKRNAKAFPKPCSQCGAGIANGGVVLEFNSTTR